MNEPRSIGDVETSPFADAPDDSESVRELKAQQRDLSWKNPEAEEEANRLRSKIELSPPGSARRASAEFDYYRASFLGKKGYDTVAVKEAKRLKRLLDAFWALGIYRRGFEEDQHEMLRDLDTTPPTPEELLAAKEEALANPRPNYLFQNKSETIEKLRQIFAPQEPFTPDKNLDAGMLLINMDDLEKYGSLASPRDLLSMPSGHLVEKWQEYSAEDIALYVNAPVLRQKQRVLGIVAKHRGFKVVEPHEWLSVMETNPPTPEELKEAQQALTSNQEEGGYEFNVGDRAREKVERTYNRSGYDLNKEFDKAKPLINWDELDTYGLWVSRPFPPGSITQLYGDFSFDNVSPHMIGFFNYKNIVSKVNGAVAEAKRRTQEIVSKSRGYIVNLNEVQ